MTLNFQIKFKIEKKKEKPVWVGTYEQWKEKYNKLYAK